MAIKKRKAVRSAKIGGKASETQIYRALRNLFNELYRTISNTNKDFKLTIGNKILTSFSDAISGFINAYLENNDNKEDKKSLIRIFIKEVSHIELMVALMVDNDAISCNVNAERVSFCFGNIKDQAYNWLGSLDINKADGVSVKQTDANAVSYPSDV